MREEGGRLLRRITKPRHKPSRLSLQQFIDTDWACSTLMVRVFKGEERQVISTVKWVFNTIVTIHDVFWREEQEKWLQI